MLLKIYLFQYLTNVSKSQNLDISSEFGRTINNISRLILLVFMIGLSQNSPFINLPNVNSRLTGNLTYLFDISMQFIQSLLILSKQIIQFSVKCSLGVQIELLIIQHLNFRLLAAICAGSGLRSGPLGWQSFSGTTQKGGICSCSLSQLISGFFELLRHFIILDHQKSISLP